MSQRYINHTISDKKKQRRPSTEVYLNKVHNISCIDYVVALMDAQTAVKSDR